jgi:hypothetical protein
MRGSSQERGGTAARDYQKLQGAVRYLLFPGSPVANPNQRTSQSSPPVKEGEQVRKRTLKPLVSGLVFLNDRRRNATALADLLATLARPLPNL